MIYKISSGMSTHAYRREYIKTHQNEILNVVKYFANKNHEFRIGENIQLPHENLTIKGVKYHHDGYIILHLM